MKKRILIVSCVLVLCACFAAGIFQHVYAEKEITTAYHAQTDSTQPETLSTEKIEGSTAADTEQPQSNSTDGKMPDAGSSGKNNKTRNTTTAAEQTSAKAAEKGQTTSSAQRAEPAKTEKSTVTVTFSISCKNALNYGADVPSDGYFLSPVSYTAEEGETVFDALKALCKDNGISLKYQDIYYIQGIGGLNEKDCGGQSGWMYRVNGTAPNKAACRYTLSDGDRVEWYYVTSSGDK